MYECFVYEESLVYERKNVSCMEESFGRVFHTGRIIHILFIYKRNPQEEP